MPDPLSTHPSDNDLKGFVYGQLAEFRQIEIEDHILHCDACCEKLEELEAATCKSVDTLLANLKNAAEPEGHSNPPPPKPNVESTGIPLVPDALAKHPDLKVHEHIGSGGMGHVFKVTERTTGKSLAIKVIKPQFLKDTNTLQRFQLEIKAALRLNHANIVQGIEVAPVEGFHMLAMEFIEGKKISEIVKSGKPLPIRNACHYARQVAMGLSHAFDQHLTHRDIKPSNLFLTRDQFVKIMDFGLAKFSRENDEGVDVSLTQEGEAFGTPDYVAPEQIRDAKSADIRADIYSLGCTLYFMLTASKPFPVGTIGEKLVSHLRRDPRPIQNLRPDVPEELVIVLDRMMKKSLTERFQTPADVVSALYPFCVKK